MTKKRILITGGAGFVGSNLAVFLADSHQDWEIICFDNLKRTGSELNLPRLYDHGVNFVRGDVRCKEDLLTLGPIDSLIECSAEPSVMAGVDGSTDYLVNTNLFGAFNCLELVRRDRAQIIFLSTSRIYALSGFWNLQYREDKKRFVLSEDQQEVGATESGIAENFTTEGPKTLYGATKISAEHLVTEYLDMFEIRGVINRCGVIAGPWQMGKVDQGVFTHWVLSHYFETRLSYIGFGGSGKQVRDLLHVDDLALLVNNQLINAELWNGMTVNVGGGTSCSLSLLETTDICEQLTGNKIKINHEPDTRQGDIPIYVSDNSKVLSLCDWTVKSAPEIIMNDIFTWVGDNENILKETLGIEKLR